MKVEKIILHKIEKELKGISTIICSDKLMTIDDTIIEFTEKLLKSYASKNPSQGTFEDDLINFPFQNRVTQYLNDDDFLSFSIDSMSYLKNRIDINTTTGGYVVFIHYVEKQSDFIITAMMDKSAQYTNTDDLGIKKLMTLNVEQLARGNRLNIQNWKKNEGRYLTFIKGTRTISQYFIKFIGATDITSAKGNFKALKDAVKNYCIENKVSRSKQEEIREKMSNYFNACLKEKKDVEIETVSALINDFEPTAFLGFIEDMEIEVSGKISIHSKDDFDNFTRSRIKEVGYNLVFENELIKKKKITRQGNNIVIHDVSEVKLDLIFNSNPKEDDKSTE